MNRRFVIQDRFRTTPSHLVRKGVNRWQVLDALTNQVEDEYATKRAAQMDASFRNRSIVRTPRELKQQPIWMGAGVTFRTVRRIQQWDGRTVGVVRNGLGGEYVVQQHAHRWDELSGVSTTELAE